MTDLASFLQTYGGWAVAAVALLALAHVYKKSWNLLETRHLEFVKILQETSNTYSSTTAALNKIIFIAERLEKRFGDNEELMREVKMTLENCKEANR